MDKRIIQEIATPEGYYHAETGLSAQEWYEILNDGTILPNQIETLLYFYWEPAHKSTCLNLGRKYECHHNTFNLPISQLGKRVQRQKGFEIIGVNNDLKSSGKNAFWNVAMDGRNIKDEGFEWKVKPEVCEALQRYLYKTIIDKYKNFRKTKSITEDDELYKWRLVTSCKGKSLLDIANRIKGTNLVYARITGARIKYLLDTYSTEFSDILSHLVNESKELDGRISNFKAEMKALYKSEDERTASVILTCHDPQHYAFYKNSYYDTFCKYIGVKANPVGKKYSHYLSLLQPLTELIDKDDEIIEMLANDLKGQESSPLLIAQDILYVVFESHHLLPKKRTSRFLWVPFFKEMAQKILPYKEKKTELASLIYQHFDKDAEIKFLHDDDHSEFEEIDPFTVFSIINRKMDNRVEMVEKMKEIFDIEAETPRSFDGVPLQNALNASFVSHTRHRSEDGEDINRLWTLFEAAVNEDDTMMASVFNKVLNQRGIGISKITMGLFYANPEAYLALDRNNCNYLEHYEVKIDSLSSYDFEKYSTLLVQIKDLLGKSIREKSFPEFSANAYNLNDSIEMETTNKYISELIGLLEKNHNLILTGAPGTGKTYLAKEIAKKMNAETGFVQFHPSYDYTDFVEGLRPSKDKELGFERKNGVFKDFCKRAIASQKPFVFIIDEINRGEISKIFGELFFSIDPGYRGEKGKVSTQYQNLIEEGDVFKEGFYVPENVYIIGTMNDIDRSVESMDFAMRRRFTWKEATAENSMTILDALENVSEETIQDIKNRMRHLNKKIIETEGLNESYQIGAAYFINYPIYNNFEDLWNYHLKGLLFEYLRGNKNAKDQLEELHKAYNLE